ncbi:c-type cytochrome [Hymenobacter psychrophilus]|uniref:Cytochrome c n=1 Tax=Hymenobacter psychrophilus TaxID=651662 RepID=A0A1H3B3X4_9BACT|nr:cytochrome c [Hymenobacter psychrophilus]SDX36378.1 Cytochrome c [Hymenobacter psychrophilus]
MNKNLPEIMMPASLAVVALLICGLLLTATGVLDEYLPTSASQIEQPGGCAVVDMPSSLNRVAFDTLHLPVGKRRAILAGEFLFKGNCAQCHGIVDVVVGPALAGVRKRRPEKWLHAWVKNSSKLIASGDEYAVKVYEQYQKQQMPSFQLSNEEISQIFDYLQAVEKQGAMVAAN